MQETEDIVTRLEPCPFCGAEEGYRLYEGSTYRWWNVQCKGCGRVIDECHSDRRTQLGTELPERWPDADEAWNNASQHCAELRATIATLRAEVEGLRADAERAVATERARCAALCLRQAGWLSVSQQALADEIRNAILGNAGALVKPAIDAAKAG